MFETLKRNSVPLIVATALFMTNLDATVLSTSLPAIARDLGLNPIHLKLALTTYLLALAVFIPASGWAADRFGPKNVFRAAMVVFAMGSIFCGLASDLASLVASRVVQGIGGAMMMPVGRLIVWRSVPKSEIIAAAAWLTIPALMGPVLGPLLGGFISTYFNWRWIFWINVPVAALGIYLVWRFIPDIRITEREDFDVKGFLLVGPGLSMFLTGATLLGLDLVTRETVIVLLLAGAGLMVAYVWHALSVEKPLIDLRLLRIPTFFAGVMGGFLFRTGIGAAPFLLPLLFQEGFGLTPFQSGLLIFATGIGSMFMKTQAARILRRWGYRNVLIANALVAAVFSSLPAFFTAATPALLISIIFLSGGLSRSLQFTGLNTLSFADVPEEKLSRATSFASVVQELSGAVGVSIAALALEIIMRIDGTTAMTPSIFPPVFLAIAVISGLSAALFAWKLDPNAGAVLLVRPGSKPEVAEEKSADAKV
ncbi:MAG: DHA2 family efflux MFS transporter permease subunit [Hyphomicrobiaceae bacterium]|nr:DHA2 family efflux MFS transporter permease subunit [Hyphomicrobiaceae bacterium]